MCFQPGASRERETVAIDYPYLQVLAVKNIHKVSNRRLECRLYGWITLAHGEVGARRHCIPSKFLIPTRDLYRWFRFNQKCAVTSRAYPSTPTVRHSSELVSIAQSSWRRCNRGIKFPSEADMFSRRPPLTSFVMSRASTPPQTALLQPVSLRPRSPQLSLTFCSRREGDFAD